MKDVAISLISFSIIAATVWAIIWGVAMAIGFLETLGLPAPLAWAGVGAAVVLCKPGDALGRYAYQVWRRVDALIWRMF